MICNVALYMKLTMVENALTTANSIAVKSYLTFQFLFFSGSDHSKILYYYDKKHGGSYVVH